jgi:hypothetical protein
VIRRYASEPDDPFPLVLDRDAKINALYGVVGLPTPSPVGMGALLPSPSGLEIGRAPGRALIQTLLAEPRAPAGAENEANRPPPRVLAIALAIHGLIGGAAGGPTCRRPAQIGALTESGARRQSHHRVARRPAGLGPRTRTSHRRAFHAGERGF